MVKNNKPTVRTNLTTKGDTYYVIISYLCDGKRKQKWINTRLSVSGHNKRKAETKCKELLVEWESKIVHDKSEMLFSDWLKEWVLSEQGKVEYSTWIEKRRAIDNTIAPYFEQQGIKLCDLQENHIEDFYKAKMNGTIGKRAVGANTILHYHAYIRKALKKAVRDKVIASNPADYVDLPKKEKHQANFYDDECLNKFLDFVKGQDIEVVALLASWFGLRRGEAAGLRWCDVDFDSKTISIRGVIRDKGTSGSKIKNMHYVPRTKSQSSMRDLAMPNASIPYLKRLKHWQDNRKSLPGYNHQWDGFICLRPNGDMIPLEYMSRKIPELTVKAGLPRLKLHELRHTNISLLYENGASMKELQEWSGDSTMRLVSDTYTHANKKSKIKLANMIDGFISA